MKKLKSQTTPVNFFRQKKILLALLAAGVFAALPSGRADGISGKAAETITTAGYTYVLVDTGSNRQWAATTEFPVAKGDRVTVAPGPVMANYHSKSLNRDFDSVIFSAQITVGGGTNVAPAFGLPPNHPKIGGAEPALPPGHMPVTTPPDVSQMDFTGIHRAPDGKTVQEIVQGRKELAGQTVTVRGRVVKYSPMVLGRNWLHIRDGSGSAQAGDNDLTVTTSDPAQVGDLVLVSGTVATNLDFGSGYKYRVLLQSAKVKAE